MVRYEVKEQDHKVVMPKPDEDPVGPKTAPVPPWFKPKGGSVFPAKRRSVKRMMLDSFIQFLARNFRRPGHPSSSAASQSKNFRPPKSANAKQSKIIHPSSP
ncbi:hypothetical protein I3760_15G028300 [Carya illinoinensis]|uniref:Uncharacterized protein n=1 Tax=Carya illinoinensis TaxID=32201 RepID=A0A922ACM8_CARIL|nr:hypothetical protein I3760_15G028300 [Carya illinoinensis]KAG6674154.1 hypothetical protein I3842_15G028900 [Carya illinoinensis]